MKNFNEAPKEKTKTILEKIRNFKKITPILITLFTTLVTENVVAKEKERNKDKNNDKKSYAYEKTNSESGTIRFFNKDDFINKKPIEGSDKIYWMPDVNPDHSIRNFTGGHSPTCPPSVVEKPEPDENKFGYGKAGSGYERGVRQAEKIEKKSKEMGLSKIDYLTWLSCKESHDPRMKQRAKELESKGKKTLKEGEARKKIIDSFTEK